MNALRRQLFALDLPPLCCYVVLLALSAGGGPWPRMLLLVLAHLALNRFGRAHAARLRDARPIPRWLGVVNTCYLLSPMFLLPVAFLSMGEVMANAGLVTPPDPVPGVLFDPDHAGERGLALGPHGAATRWDQRLKALDIAIFGVYPTAWVRRLHTPWLTGVLQVGYLSYYFAPAALCVPLLVARRRTEFRVVAATLAACCVTTYFGYLLVPATGPRFEGGIAAVLPREPGWFSAEDLYRFLDSIEVFRWDAFPSGHTAVGLCALLLAFRYERRIAWPLLLPVLLLIAATIYMGYHYVVDVLAGLVIGVASARCVPAFVLWWDEG